MYSLSDNDHLRPVGISNVTKKRNKIIVFISRMRPGEGVKLSAVNQHLTFQFITYFEVAKIVFNFYFFRYKGNFMILRDLPSHCIGKKCACR
jgi:hypothetical protein